MPNVIRINGFGSNGTFQIGNNGERYALMDTLLLSNVRGAGRAGAGGGTTGSLCTGLEAALLARRKQWPMKTWEDGDRGRHTSLPGGSGTAASPAAAAVTADTGDERQGEWFRSLLRRHP